jgi:hypothetical protein
LIVNTTVSFEQFFTTFLQFGHFSKNVLSLNAKSSLDSCQFMLPQKTFLKKGEGGGGGWGGDNTYIKHHHKHL